MNLQDYLDQRHITKYRLSQLSGIPNTTIIDICSGKSDIKRCSAKTVMQIAKALGCTMEDIMLLASRYSEETGRPNDKSYLEHGLPGFLQKSVRQMEAAWKKRDKGEMYLHWDCDYCSLQSDINIAETSGQISTEQAWYLREKYLRMERV